MNQPQPSKRDELEIIVDELWRFAKRPPTAGGQPAEMRPGKLMFYDKIVSLISHIREQVEEKTEIEITEAMSFEKMLDLPDKQVVIVEVGKIKKALSHIREEAVGERDGELLREAYEMDKEKTRLAIESHKYPEGVHDPRIYALVRELQARADALKPKESL